MLNKAIVVAIIKKDDKYLLSRHTRLDKWSFVMGKIEPSDITPSRALEREVLEEIGVTVIKRTFWQIYEITYDKTLIKSYVYTLDSFDGEVVNNEPDKCKALIWVTMAEMQGLLNIGELDLIASSIINDPCMM